MGTPTEKVQNKSNTKEKPVTKQRVFIKNQLPWLTATLASFIVLNAVLYFFLPKKLINNQGVYRNSTNNQNTIESTSKMSDKEKELADPLEKGFWEGSTSCDGIDLKVNETKKIAELVCTTDTGEKAVLELPRVDLNKSKVSEKANGDLYVTRRIGEWHSIKDTWHDELWKFTKNLRGKRIYTRKGISFNVSEDKDLIAIEGEKFLTLINKEGKEIEKIDVDLLKVFPEEDYFPGFYEWESNYIWLVAKLGPNLMGLSKYNLNTREIKRYDLTKLPIGEEYDLNTKTNLLAFSTFPALFEVRQAEIYAESGKEVKLYVYDLDKKTKNLINTSITKRFTPFWIDEDTLEYSDPNGTGKLLY